MPVLSKNELSEIEQKLLKENELIITFKKFSNETVDPQLKILYQQIAATHQNNYQMLIALLEN